MLGPDSRSIVDCSSFRRDVLLTSFSPAELHVSAVEHSPMYAYRLSVCVTRPWRCLNRLSGLKIIPIWAGLSCLSLLNHTIRDSFGGALRPAGVGLPPRKHQAEREREMLHSWVGAHPKDPQEPHLYILTGIKQDCKSVSCQCSDMRKPSDSVCLHPKKKKPFRGYANQKKSDISYYKSLIRNVSSFLALLAFRVQEKA